MVNQVTFLNKNYSEAQTLLLTSKEYIKWQAPLDIEKMSSQDKIKATHEIIRVALRLSEISVWLVVQKAVQRGEISHKESLNKEYKALRSKACLNKDSENDPVLPRRLRELLEMSRILYYRILRLDQVSRSHLPTSTKIKKTTTDIKAV